MKKKFAINGYKFDEDVRFAFDGCHKIYILGNNANEGQMIEYGYKIYPIKDIKECYKNSCPLKFIEMISMSGNEEIFETIIPQCTKARDISWRGFGTRKAKTAQLYKSKKGE